MRYHVAYEVLIWYGQDKTLLVDLNPLHPIPKSVPPEASQLPNESHQFWAPLTNAIRSKNWNEASNAKHTIEERQRAKAAERKASNKDWQPRFFTASVTPKGRPELTEDGWAAIKKLHEHDYNLEPNKELGA